MDVNMNVYLKYCEYHFYVSRGLIMLMYVNTEVHLRRFLPLMHHAMQFLIL